MQTHCSDQAHEVAAVIVGQLLSTAHRSIVDWGSMADALQQVGETIIMARAHTEGQPTLGYAERLHALLLVVENGNPSL